MFSLLISIVFYILHICKDHADEFFDSLMLTFVVIFFLTNGVYDLTFGVIVKQYHYIYKLFVYSVTFSLVIVDWIAFKQKRETIVFFKPYL